MNIKTKIAINKIKKDALNGWYFCMKPLANAIRYCEDRKYKKNSEYLKELPLEEVARLYVKTIVKSMAKRNNPAERYYHCEAKGNTSDYYEDNCMKIFESDTVYINETGKCDDFNEGIYVGYNINYDVKERNI